MALSNVVYKHYDNQRFSYVNEGPFGFMLITCQYNHAKFERLLRLERTMNLLCHLDGGREGGEVREGGEGKEGGSGGREGGEGWREGREGGMQISYFPQSRIL